MLEVGVKNRKWQRKEGGTRRKRTKQTPIITMERLIAAECVLSVLLFLHENICLRHTTDEMSLSTVSK